MDPDLSKDYEAVVTHAAFKGYQAASLLTPPLYLAVTVLRRGRAGLSINRVCRATWIGGLAGTGLGGAAGWGRLRGQPPEAVHDRAVRLAYNTSQLRNDDYVKIGGTLGAVLTPALLWNYGRLAHLVLGGAGFGAGAGVITHVSKSFGEGEAIKPEGMRDTLEGK